MNIYCAANELDLINFSGAGFSRKLGTYDDSLSRCSIALPGGSGSAISIDTLDITEGDLGIHFCLATTSVEEEPVITDFIRIEDVLSNKTSVLLKRLEDDTITIQLNTNTADGTPAPSSQKLQFSGLRHFDLFLSYNSGTDETTLQLYVDSLLSNTVTESGSIIYPTKIGFNSASNSTYYISQIVVSDELARNIRVKTLVPVDNGYYTAWTNDYKKVYDIEVNDSETIIASEEGIQESYLVSVPNGDLYFNNVFVLHHFEDTVDSSYSKNNLLIQGSAALSATSPIMGSKSLYIPQVVESFAWIEGSDSLTFDDNDLCIEILVKFEDISTDAVILSQGTLDGPLWRLKRESNNTIVFLATNLSATDPFPVVLTSTDLANEIGVQYTLRVTRQGDVWTLYMDGSIQQSVMWAGSVQTQNQNLILGTTIDYANQMFGYMDEFRLTIGQSR